MYMYMNVDARKSEICFSKGDNVGPIASPGQAKEDTRSRGQRVATVTREGQSRSSYMYMYMYM